MTKVVDIDTARPHVTNTIICDECSHKWVAVYPERTSGLECPNCHIFVNDYGIKVTKRVCKTCNREFTVCPPVDDSNPNWDNCLAPDCASYDKDRDVDDYFD